MKRIRLHSNLSIKKQKSLGLSAVEVLIAVLISLAFLSSATAAFIQIMKASEMADRKMNAINNARAALDIMRLDIAAARFVPFEASTSFIGINNPLTYGNMVDEDLDGVVDEETADGLDNDNDWIAAQHDQHAQLGTAVFERSDFVGSPDWGDEQVDEDNLFENDTLRFRVFPRDPLQQEEAIFYRIGSFGTTNNVLLRRITTSTSVRDEPIAFDVLSINFLYWDANRLTGANPYWIGSWNADFSGVFPAPGLELPAAVRIDITVYAGTSILDNVALPPTNPLETVTLSTVVNIEQMINDPRYLLVRQGTNNGTP